MNKKPSIRLYEDEEDSNSIIIEISLIRSYKVLIDILNFLERISES